MWSRDGLVASLKSLGLLRNPDVERAFRGVDQEPFLPSAFSVLAYADMPIPVFLTLGAPTMPSARCLASALELLEPTPGARVLLVGARGGFPAALLAAISGPEHVVVLERDPDLRAATASRLREAGLDAVRVVPEPPQETFERILLMDARGPGPRDVTRLLADGGFLISRGRGLHDLAFVKMVHRGPETVQIAFSEAPFPVLAGPRTGDRIRAVDFGRLFAVEDLLTHVWEDRVTGHYDQHFRDVTDETFSGGPMDTPDPSPTKDPAIWAARQSFQAAYILQSAGELDRAADAYERSLHLAPSAEAHTFLGWTYSFMGRYDDAIEECRRAIAIDPTFGNPFNDIGAYLLELGRLDEAIPWLEKAVAASRYCCYFYAHTNLARVYLLQGKREKARKSLIAALRVNPDYRPARELLRRLERGDAYFA